MARSKTLLLIMASCLVAMPLSAQDSDTDGSVFADAAGEQVDVAWSGPVKDASFHLIWLIESDDENRKPYSGPAADALADAGFHRLVQAGSLRSCVTIGQKSIVSGASRYGPLMASISMLNTTNEGELQLKIDVRTKSQTPISIETTVRVPLGHWVLLGAVDSRTGLPKFANDGKRSVLMMKVTEGILVLE